MYNNRARGTRGPRPTTIKKPLYPEGRTRKCITSHIILYTFYNTCRIISHNYDASYTWQTSSANIVCIIVVVVIIIIIRYNFYFTSVSWNLFCVNVLFLMTWGTESVLCLVFVESRIPYLRNSIARIMYLYTV